MVSVFLKAEINSNRFGHFITDKLKEDGLDVSVIEKPNLTDEKENIYRKEVLTAYRGFENRTAIFGGFPSNSKWVRVLLDKDDLYKVKYINYDYWNELSSGTRLAKDAAKNIKSGVVIFNQPNDNFLKAAEAISKGVKFPEMIMVSVRQGADLIVLEGHLRLTAYMLVPDLIPDEMVAIVGYSEDFVNWGLY